MEWSGAGRRVLGRSAVSRNARLEAYLGLARDRSWSKAEPSLPTAGNQRLLSALGSISCLVPGQVIIDGVRVAGERAAEANFGIGENRASENRMGAQANRLSS